MNRLGLKLRSSNLKAAYPKTSVIESGPLKLEAVRNRMIESGNSRRLQPVAAKDEALYRVGVKENA